MAEGLCLVCAGFGKQTSITVSHDLDVVDRNGSEGRVGVDISIITHKVYSRRPKSASMMETLSHPVPEGLKQR